MHNGSTTQELYVMGAGWFSVEVAGWARESGWRVRGLVELMDPARAGGDQEGYPIVDAASLPAGTLAIAAGGRPGDPRGAWGRGEGHRFAPAPPGPPTAPIPTPPAI